MSTTRKLVIAAAAAAVVGLWLMSNVVVFALWNFGGFGLRESAGEPTAEAVDSFSAIATALGWCPSPVALRHGSGPYPVGVR